MPALKKIAIEKGFLEEADFETVGLWQTKEEKEKARKNPRDSLPLHCQRAVVLTTSGAIARMEQRKQDIAAEKAKKEKAAEKKKADAVRKQRINDGWKLLKEDINTGLPVRANEKHSDDVPCYICKTWFWAWDEAKLPNEEFQWLQCCGCEEWVCPHCLSLGFMEAHERQCKREKVPQKSLKEAQQRKRKREQKQNEM
jgi:hypothetical protein